MRSSTLFVFPAIIIGILFFAIPFTAKAFIPIPFGGVAITPPVLCLGSGLYWMEILQPPPRPPLTVIFYPSPFLYYMMTHTGQFVLGLLYPIGWCLTSWKGAGFWASTASFYGTSI